MSTARIGSNVQGNWRSSVSTIHNTWLAARLPDNEIRTTQNVVKTRLPDNVVINFGSWSQCFICPQMTSCCNMQRGTSGTSRDNVWFSMYWTESSTDSNTTATVPKWLIYLATVSVTVTYCHCARHLPVSQFTVVQFITKRCQFCSVRLNKLCHFFST